MHFFIMSAFEDTLTLANHVFTSEREIRRILVTPPLPWNEDE